MDLRQQIDLARHELESHFRDADRRTRQLIVGIVGGTVLLLGCIMVFLPGPGSLVIPAGLAILGIEFVWARRALAVFREKAMAARAEAEEILTRARDPEHLEELRAGIARVRNTFRLRGRRLVQLTMVELREIQDRLTAQAAKRRSGRNTGQTGPG